jgi:hypothetical protein
MRPIFILITKSPWRASLHIAVAWAQFGLVERSADFGLNSHVNGRHHRQHGFHHRSLDLSLMLKPATAVHRRAWGGQERPEAPKVLAC